MTTRSKSSRKLAETLAWVGISAFATMGLTLACFWAVPATAVEESPAKAVIKVPVLKTGNCELSVRQVTEVATAREGALMIEPGDIPALELVAKNTGTTEETVQWNGSLTVNSMLESMSRVAVPRQVLPSWTDKGDIVLAPGETKVIALGAKGKINVMSTATLVLQAGNQSVAAISFTSLAQVKAAASPAPNAPVTVKPTAKSSANAQFNAAVIAKALASAQDARQTK